MGKFSAAAILFCHFRNIQIRNLFRCNKKPDRLLEQCFSGSRYFAFEATVDIDVNINAGLKRKRKQIDIADLFIAATAINFNLPIATLNRKHFERIEILNIRQ